LFRRFYEVISARESLRKAIIVVTLFVHKVILPLHSCVENSDNANTIANAAVYNTIAMSRSAVAALCNVGFDPGKLRGVSSQSGMLRKVENDSL
jgi:hypothetical protein